MAQSPLLFLNPADDAEFAGHVDRLMAAGFDEPAALERELRSRYPDAVVRPRDLANERIAVWYVYRDGHWSAGA
jgi:hypothetical protein